MQWDLGLEGLALLAAIALVFGVAAGLLVGGGRPRRLWAIGLGAVACFGAGLVTSEGVFGSSTEQDLQPYVDGLTRDEVLLSSVLTTVVVVVAMRYLARHGHEPHLRHARPAVGRHRALHP
ncbi:hypothetical protein [Nocardioides sp.]|uniref:hypothetical protein n=1 Tax=Nocardioides sp. TaxID=35761 RepID=UPI002EDB109C